MVTNSQLQPRLITNYPLDPKKVGFFEKNVLNNFGHPAMTFRTDAAKAVGGYDSNFIQAEDFEFWIRLSKIGRIENLNQTVGILREHGESKSALAGYDINKWAQKAVIKNYPLTGVGLFPLIKNICVRLAASAAYGKRFRRIGHSLWWLARVGSAPRHIEQFDGSAPVGDYSWFDRYKSPRTAKIKSKDSFTD